MHRTGYSMAFDVSPDQGPTQRPRDGALLLRYHDRICRLQTRKRAVALEIWMCSPGPVYT